MSRCLNSKKEKKTIWLPWACNNIDSKAVHHGSKLVYYELLHRNKPITKERYQQRLINFKRALKTNQPEYAERHDKVDFSTFYKNCQSLDIALSDYHLFLPITHDRADQYFRFYEETVYYQKDVIK